MFSHTLVCSWPASKLAYEYGRMYSYSKRKVMERYAYPHILSTIFLYTAAFIGRIDIYGPG